MRRKGKGCKKQQVDVAASTSAHTHNKNERNAGTIQTQTQHTKHNTQNSAAMLFSLDHEDFEYSLIILYYMLGAELCYVMALLVHLQNG